MERGRRLKALLDTHTFIWWLTDDDRLSQRVKLLICDPESEIYVSAATVWEIATKIRIGKLDASPFANGIQSEIEIEQFIPIAVSVIHAERAGYLDHKHKDPFDRMLIAQALVEGLVIISNETLFDQFGVPRLW
jgi:PIN domain nuclease of toxin-antitoxin system